MTGCAATKDGWAAKGVATNSTKKSATYVITVFFTTGGATVQDFSSVKVTVKPGEKTTWTAAKKFRASNPTLCVLRGVA